MEGDRPSPETPIMLASPRHRPTLPTFAAALLSCCAALGSASAAADDGAAGSAAEPVESMDPRESAVHFGFDEDYMAREAEIKVAWLIAAEQGPMDRVEIEGYADSTGPEAYNVELSLRRARSVRDFLVEELGIDRSALSVVAYGEAYPAAPNTTPDGRAANRRVEFRRVDPAEANAGS